MKNILLFIVTIMVAITVNFKTAHATPYQFNYSNAFGPGAYGAVDIEKLADETLKFTLTANESYFGSSGLVWDKFYFNSGKDNITLGFTPSLGNWSVNTNKNVSEFGWFDYEVKGNGITSSNNPLMFSLVPSPLLISDVTVLNSDDWMFAAHLRGFDEIQGQTSTFLVVGSSPSPVPEPATMLLFGTGLTGLAGTRIRRKKK